MGCPESSFASLGGPHTWSDGRHSTFEFPLARFVAPSMIRISLFRSKILAHPKKRGATTASVHYIYCQQDENEGPFLFETAGRAGQQSCGYTLLILSYFSFAPGPRLLGVQTPAAFSTIESVPVALTRYQ